jgi:hypothetical protein
MHTRKGIVGSRTKEHLKWCLMCDSAEIFITSIFSYLLLSIPPPIKLKMELQIGRRLLRANQLGNHILWLADQKWGAESDHIY